jgi:hypothetical protein
LVVFKNVLKAPFSVLLWHLNHYGADERVCAFVHYGLVNADIDHFLSVLKDLPLKLLTGHQLLAFRNVRVNLVPMDRRLLTDEAWQINLNKTQKFPIIKLAIYGILKPFEVHIEVKFQAVI